jgi:hypothetical protein
MKAHKQKTDQLADRKLADLPVDADTAREVNGGISLSYGKIRFIYTPQKPE